MPSRAAFLMFAACSRLVCFSILKCSGSECEFQQDWRGTWSPDLNSNEEIRITNVDMTSKGLCFQQHREYHLIENRREHCHQCLLLQLRHPNVLQYKESYCIGRTALQSICGQLEVDRHLSVQTLVRVDATPSECPLRRAYHVTYSNFSGCFCRSPTSYAHTCSSQTSIVFRLRQCRQCPNTFEQNLELECLATWKEGAKYYGVGRFSSYSRSIKGDNDDGDDNGDDDHYHNDDDAHDKRIRYRCFMYHIVGAVAYLSISNDASCQSLRSAREGPLLLELTEDFFGWPGSLACSFPSWLTASRWFLVPNSHLLFEAGDSNDTLTGRSTAASSPDQTLKSFKCLRIEHDNSTSSTFIGRPQIDLLVQAFDGCQASYRCISLVRRRKNMASLQIASTEQENNRCPLRGRYLSTSPKCRVEMKFSCGPGDGIEMIDQCFPGKVERMICLSWWKDHGSIHLIAERTGSNSVSCFTFQHLGDGSTLVSHEEDCPKHLDHLAGQFNTSSFIIQFKDKCRERASVRSNEHSLDSGSFPPSIIQSDDFQRPRLPVARRSSTPATSSSSPIQPRTNPALPLVYALFIAHAIGCRSCRRHRCRCCCCCC